MLQISASLRALRWKQTYSWIWMELFKNGNDKKSFQKKLSSDFLAGIFDVFGFGCKRSGEGGATSGRFCFRAQLGAVKTVRKDGIAGRLNQKVNEVDNRLTAYPLVPFSTPQLEYRVSNRARHGLTFVGKTSLNSTSYEAIRLRGAVA